MRRIGAVTAAAIVLGGIGALPAHADTTGTTLYVNPRVACSDTDPASGSVNLPYCSLQAAVDAAQPGTTVQAAPSAYNPVRITRSGTADRPIVIRGATTIPASPAISIREVAGRHVPAVDIDGASYVTVSGLWITAVDTEPVRVHAADHVSLVDDTLIGGRSATPQPPAVEVDGSTSTSVTQTRAAYGPILVHGGSQGTRLTDSLVVNSRADGIDVDSASDTRLLNTTVSTAVGDGVVVRGSTGTRIADSVLGFDAGGVELSVDVDSAESTTADHNVLQPTVTGTAYTWGASTFGTADAFQQATGQGTQDCAGACGISVFGQPQEKSPAIDSEDPAVTGLPDTDVAGQPRVDDPLTGAAAADGSSVVDRGAYEFQDPITATLTATPDQPPAAYPAVADKLQVTLKNPWGSQVTSYDYVLGDGTPDITTTDAQVTHTYTQPGTWYPRVTLTTDTKRTLTVGSSGVYVENPPPLTPQPVMSRTGSAPMSVVATLGESSVASGWPVTGRTVNWGDGSATENAGIAQQATHTYARPGRYQVTQTSTDADGRTAQTTVPVVVGSAFVAHAPVRLLDTRTTLGGHRGPLAANATLALKVTGVTGAPASGVTAVVLNVTSANPASAGYLTAYSSAGSRTFASSLNFAAHENRSNLVTVPVGPDGRIRIYAHARTDVVVDLAGYYATGTQVTGGTLFDPAAPVRLLDTRITRTTPVASGETVKVPVGQQVGSGATAVVVNITAVDPGSDGYVTAFGSGKAPTASSVNFRRGHTTAAQVVVPIGPDGTVSLYNHGGTVQLLADLEGWYAPGTGSVFLPTGPDRVLDSRNNSWPLRNGQEFAIATGVPDGATAVLLNLTETDAAGAGYLTVHPTGQPVPTASTLNFVAGQTSSNSVVVAVPVGEWNVYNHSTSVDVVADMQGWFG